MESSTPTRVGPSNALVRTCQRARTTRRPSLRAKTTTSSREELTGRLTYEGEEGGLHKRLACARLLPPFVVMQPARGGTMVRPRNRH